jgi:hypothetical protein
MYLGYGKVTLCSALISKEPQSSIVMNQTNLGSFNLATEWFRGFPSFGLASSYQPFGRFPPNIHYLSGPVVDGTGPRLRLLNLETIEIFRSIT